MMMKLASRDRQVRAHEAAHAAVGGQYTSAPSFTYQKGPDGRMYAIGGEVDIDVSPVSGDPQATLEKARLVRRAALAPANPSAQDRQVAMEARKMAMEARAELREQQQKAAGEGSPQATEQAAAAGRSSKAQGQQGASVSAVPPQQASQAYVNQSGPGASAGANRAGQRLSLYS